MAGPSDGTRSLGNAGELRAALDTCRRCCLWRNATQGVPGEGDVRAKIMLVGEQPGDAEDRQGHPFVGPAGAMLAKALDEAGLDRGALWITNAVKHFKHEPRGKRRLHKKPTIGEITACRWWLQEELRLIAPHTIVALGATAVRGITGRTMTVSAMRGEAHRHGDAWLWVTIHPSYLLRLQDEADRRAEFRRFVKDLEDAKATLRRAAPRDQAPGPRAGMPSVRSGA